MSNKFELKERETRSVHRMVKGLTKTTLAEINKGQKAI